MVKVLRSVLAIFAGLLAGMVCVGGLEVVGHLVFPPPPGLDFTKSESIAAAMKAMPSGAFVLLLLSWASGTFAGAWVASKIAAVGKLAHGMVIGLFFLAAGVANMLMIPHPSWVWVVGSLEYLPMAYLGAWLATRKPGPRIPTPQMA